MNLCSRNLPNLVKTVIMYKITYSTVPNKRVAVIRVLPKEFPKNIIVKEVITVLVMTFRNYLIKG